MRDISSIGLKLHEGYLPRAVVNTKGDAIDIHLHFLHIDLDRTLLRSAGRIRLSSPYTLAYAARHQRDATRVRKSNNYRTTASQRGDLIDFVKRDFQKCRMCSIPVDMAGFVARVET